jgi:hypothetical protein
MLRFSTKQEIIRFLKEQKGERRLSVWRLLFVSRP